jgi:hypothetical protein
MRTKTLLLSAAALAAGLLSSIASSSNVYSVNIVGYVNKPGGLGFTPMSNPLIANISNSASNVIDNASGQQDGNALYIWNGFGFTVYLFDSSSPSGYTDVGANPVAPPTLTPGTGFLYNNQVASNTLTYVGQVTGVVTNDPHLIADLTLPASPGNQLIASPIPIGGRLITDLQMDGTGTLDGDAVQLPNITGGVLTSWTVYLFDSSSGTGFTDAGSNPVPEPIIPVAGAFLFVNNNATPVLWHQDIDLGP